MAHIDELGREVLDQTPVAIPVPFTRPEPIHLRLRRIVEQYHSEMRDAAEYETFEDADDFDVDDGMPSYEDAPSEYERDFMPREELLRKLFPDIEPAEVERAAKQVATPSGTGVAGSDPSSLGEK